MISDAFTMVGRRHESALLWSTRTGEVTFVHGEVDISTCESFATMVQASIGRAENGGVQHEVHLDLGGLEFIDVSGARVLVAAGAGRGPGSQLVIDRPPTLLARILDVGWGPLTGLRLEAGELIGDANSDSGVEALLRAETISPSFSL